MNSEEDDDEYLYGELTNEKIRQSEIIFSEGCREGFDALVEDGEKCFKGKDKFTASTIKRMLGYFIQTEEYEKCSILKVIFEKEFGITPTPVFPEFD